MHSHDQNPGLTVKAMTVLSQDNPAAITIVHFHGCKTTGCVQGTFLSPFSCLSRPVSTLIVFVSHLLFSLVFGLTDSTWLRDDIQPLVTLESLNVPASVTHFFNLGVTQDRRVILKVMAWRRTFMHTTPQFDTTRLQTSTIWTFFCKVCWCSE